MADDKNNIIPDFIKVPLAFTALNLPNTIMHMKREQQEAEDRRRAEEAKLKSMEEANKSFWSW